VGGAQTTYTHKFSTKEITTGTGSATWDKVKWSWTKPLYIGYDTSTDAKGVQIGSSKKPQTNGWTISTEDISGTITSVKVNASTGGSAKLSVKVGDTDYKLGTNTNVSLTSSATDYEFTGSASGKIAITMKASSKAMYIKSITVTSSNKTATTLTFTNAGDKTYTVGDENNAAVYSNPAKLTTTDGTAIDGTITYTSSNSDFASVESNGDVLVNTKATGSATITATYAGNDTYVGSTASYKITVAPKPTGAGTEANPYTVADVVALNNAGLLPTDSAYVKGIISEVGDFNSKFSELTYYISDDGKTTSQLQVYQGLGLNGDKFTAATDLQTGWTVVVKGKLKVFNSTLEFNYGSKITSLTKPVTYTKATLTGFAQSGNDYYATFSSDQVTFFPEGDADVTFTTTVQKAYAVGDMLELTSLATDNATISGNEVSGYFVPANTGVLIKASFDGTTSVPYYTVTGKTVDELTDNMLYPASKAMSELVDSYYFYKLAYDDYSAKTGLGFYWGADNGAAFTAKTNGAYLAVPKSSTSAKSGFRFDGTTTGVNTINAKTTTNDVIYNIQGQRVGASYKGLVIVNGKKMMRK
jgi:hypothetical protein